MLRGSRLAAGPRTPDVSTAKGTKCTFHRDWNISRAYAPLQSERRCRESRADWTTAVAEKVSEQVASHTRFFSMIHENRDIRQDAGRRPCPDRRAPEHFRSLHR